MSSASGRSARGVDDASTPPRATSDRRHSPPAAVSPFFLFLDMDAGLNGLLVLFQATHGLGMFRFMVARGSVLLGAAVTTVATLLMTADASSCLLLFAIEVLGPAPARPGDIVDTASERVRVVTVAQGLDRPWSVAFLPDGDLLVTERGGRLRIVRNGVLDVHPIAGVPAVHAHEHGGLFDVVLHPRFPENHFVYLTYSTAGAYGATVALARGRFTGNALVDVHPIFVADAWSTTDLQFGSRVAFGRDGVLYMSIGDRNERQRAQDLGDHAGTIVRIRDDGSVPDDNPFVGRSDARPEIYSFGHRNVQGLAVHPETGVLWATEHGPYGGDEVNVILPGKNYGWPIATFGREYDGAPIGTPCATGTEPPFASWVPSIGISGMTFYAGHRFPSWAGNLFVAALSQHEVQRVTFVEAGPYRHESLLAHLGQRVRDIRQGPDDLLYVVIDGVGRILRIEPAGASEVPIPSLSVRTELPVRAQSLAVDLFADQHDQGDRQVPGCCFKTGQRCLQ